MMTTRTRSKCLPTVILLIVCSINASVSDDGLCTIVKCIKGTCINIEDSPFPRCECDEGWKQPEPPLITSDTVPFLPCIIPNYNLAGTFNTNCDAEPPPPPGGSPPVDIFHPCTYINCGMGTCEETPPAWKCNCEEGYENLLNIPEAPCMKPCELDVDCSQLGIGKNPPPRADTSPNNNKNRGVVDDIPRWIVVAINSLCFLILFA